ncbi:MAG: hypothetical protein HY921_03835 [Elusimicrobia bacterium]|nr:hypothetical protein [Elusimicrobiota bacterium]
MKRVIYAAAAILLLPCLGPAAPAKNTKDRPKAEAKKPAPKPKPQPKPKIDPVISRIDKSSLGAYQKLLAKSIVESKLEKVPAPGKTPNDELKAWNAFIQNFVLGYMGASGPKADKSEAFETKYVQKRAPKLLAPAKPAHLYRNAIKRELDAYMKSSKASFDPKKVEGGLDSIGEPPKEPQGKEDKEPLSAFESALIESFAQEPLFKTSYDSYAAGCKALNASPVQSGCWRGKIADILNTYKQSSKADDKLAAMEAAYIQKRLASDYPRFQKLLDEAAKDKQKLPPFIAQWRAAIKVEFDGYKDSKYAPTELSSLLKRTEDLNKDPFAVALSDLFANPVVEAFVEQNIIEKAKNDADLEKAKKEIIELSKADKEKRKARVGALQKEVFPKIKDILDKAIPEKDYPASLKRRGITQNNILGYYCPLREKKGAPAQPTGPKALPQLQGENERGKQAVNATSPEGAAVKADVDQPKVEKAELLCRDYEAKNPPDVKPPTGPGKPSGPPTIGGPKNPNHKDPPAKDKNAWVIPIYTAKMATYAGILGLFFGGPAGMALVGTLGTIGGYAMALDSNK